MLDFFVQIESFRVKQISLCKVHKCLWLKTILKVNISVFFFQPADSYKSIFIQEICSYKMPDKHTWLVVAHWKFSEYFRVYKPIILRHSVAFMVCVSDDSEFVRAIIENVYRRSILYDIFINLKIRHPEKNYLKNKMRNRLIYKPWFRDI